MKDVATCEKPRGGGKQPLIRGYPNGETRLPDKGSHNPGRPGAWEPAEVKHLSKRRKRKQQQSLLSAFRSTERRSESNDYIPLVAASETGVAQTYRVF